MFRFFDYGLCDRLFIGFTGVFLHIAGGDITEGVIIRETWQHIGIDFIQFDPADFQTFVKPVHPTICNAHQMRIAHGVDAVLKLLWCQVKRA